MILCRTHPTERRLDTPLVVVDNIFLNCYLQLLAAVVDAPIVNLLLQKAEEVLHHTVVQTVPLARHALKDALLPQPVHLRFHLIRPPLIGVKCAAVGEICCDANRLL